jgi:hypothetical protein
MKRTRGKNKPLKPIVHLKHKQKLQPVNPNHWSTNSKRSTTFILPPSHYEDIHYKCARCNRDSVFSAIDPKLTFEGRKAYIWQRRNLCRECWSERRRRSEGFAGASRNGARKSAHCGATRDSSERGWNHLKGIPPMVHARTMQPLSC